MQMAFGCPLCRRKLPKNLMTLLGQEVMKRKLVESITLLMGMLEFGGEKMDEIVVSLLIEHHFNVNKVENVLFTMVGYTTVQQTQRVTNVPTSHEEKQNIFETARGPY
mmetsp:Transcript_13561/g.20992  ORF Transcript_13561/g.20992 Transcript_13561/m.20992 type:complete len:108 (-) Transcript_13561:176-499(-)